MTGFFIAAGIVVGLALAILRARDWLRGDEKSEPLSSKESHRIVVAGRAGVTRVTKPERWLA
jgi:hypothetical protein